MNGDDHIKQLLKQGLDKFDVKDQLDKTNDPRTQAPDEVPSFEDLGYDYETNPVLKERVEAEIRELKKKDGIE